MQFYYEFAILAILGTSNAAVRNCRQAQKQLDATKDGEYCISVDGAEDFGQTIYCYGMDTYNPTEYLTLPGGGEENFSATSKANHASCMVGTLKFDKVGLDLDAMVVKSWDDTFATKTGIDVTKDECDSQAFFGRAFGCPNPEGKVSVNFEGTGFYIPETVQWYAYGWVPEMTLHQNTNQRVEATCTGFCGGCEPREVENVSLYSGVGITNKVMPIAFDQTLNKKPCAL